MKMVDRADPPTDAQVAELHRNGTQALALYIGGVNDGGRAWHPEHAAAMRAAFKFILPIYVGENYPESPQQNLKTPLVLTRTQGAYDGADAVACAKRYGFTSGPVCLDVENATYMHDPAGALAYMESWAKAVRDAGYLPVLYAVIQTATDYVPRPGEPVGLWIANWDGRGNLEQFPHRERWTGIGWQYADNDGLGDDLSNVDGGWWQTVAPTPAPAPHYSLDASDDPWKHDNLHGDFDILNVFIDDIYRNGGFMPVGFCVTGAFGEGDVVVQYFERARLELHADGSVTRGLLGLEVLAGRHPDKLPT